MTAQAKERLLYKGEKLWMAAEPLNEYLKNRKDLQLQPPTTACWRGYYGNWEIKDDKLFLIGLVAYIEDYKEVDLNYLFPGQDKVFANWYDGEIRIPQGKMLEYEHIGYVSKFEKELILKFDKGVLISEILIDNREEKSLDIK